MRKYLIYSFVLILVLSNAFYLTSTAQAQTWTMDRYNPSRTNQGSIIGPRNLPNFVPINNSINGSLVRSGPDGSIITWNPLIGSTGFGQIHRYLLSGSTSWDSSVPTDGFGLKDVAIDQNGTIYVVSMGQVTALNKSTGNPTWTFQGGSDQSSPLAIGKQGTIYYHSGAAFFGSSETVTAIAPDGTSLWQAIGTFRGDSRMVFSTDESAVYLLNTKTIFGSPIGNVTSYSTVDGHKISDTPCDPRGMLFAYAPWNVLYSFAVDGAFFLGLSPDLSSCPLVSANGLSTVDMAATTRQGRIIIQNFDGSIAVIDQSSNNILFNSNEPLVNGFVDSAGILFAENPQTNEIVAVDTVSLSQLWRSNIKDPITGFSLGSDGNLYVSAGTALLKSAPVQQPVWPMSGHDPQRTGLSTFVSPTSVPSGPSWTFASGGPVIGDLAVSAEGKIYFSSDKLYALNPDGTIYVPAVAIVPITSPAIDDLNGFVYVIVVSDSRNYDVLRYSKQLQNPVVVYHGAFSFVNPTSMTVGPDGTIYFSDGVSLIAVGPHSWRTQDRPCFGNPGFLAPTLGRDGSVYSMCNSGGGIGFGSGIYRYDGDTGIQIVSAGYSRGGTELIIDTQNDIRAGFQAFDGGTFGGAYDAWDANLIKLTPGNNGDFTTSRSALFPDGLSTVRIGFSFQPNILEASGAHTWGILSGPQTLPAFSTPPTVDAAGNVFVGTMAGLAALNGIDGHVIWFNPVSDIITTQPAVSPDGSLIVGSSSGTIYAFASKPTTGTIIVSTDNPAAIFTISDGGSNTFTGSGTSFTQTAPAGKYTIIFEPIAGFITPPQETKLLDSNGKIEFIASYLQHISVSPNTLEFDYPKGATGVIPQQELSVQTSATPVHLSISTSTETGGNWLSISGTTLASPANILVGVSNSLPEGQYRGAVHIHAFGGVDSNDLIVPVSLTVGSPAAVQINVELLDPSPVVENMQIVNPDTPAHISLLSSSTLQPLEGAATDGVSKLLVRISVSQPGETVLFLTDSLGKVSLPSEDAGTIPSDTLPTVGDNKVFAVYAAPNQFVRSQVPSDADASQRQVYLRVVFIPPNSPAIQSELFPIILERPPIILVHGLWSDDSAWDSFPLTSSVNCADTGKLYACRINYGPDAASSFAVIASEVGPVLRAKIAQFRKDRHVAALQADVIAHSMGGDIVRTLPLCNNMVPSCTFTYKTSANLGLGDVHSLVTIGTPHRGTPIANDLIQHLNTRCCPYLTCFGRDPLFKDAFRAQNGNSLDAGAVQDLQENSTAINAIQNATADFPMHFVVGIANSTDESLLDQGLVKTIRDQCSSSILPDHIRSIFNMDSDLLVSESSQRNSSVVVSPSHCVTRSLNLIHTNLLINPGQTGFSPDELTSQTLGLDVLKLLDSPASFCK